MNIFHRKESMLLLFGDLSLLFVSLYGALFLRYQKLPDDETIATHLLPFGILSLFWIAVFFIAGLYEKHTLILKSRLPVTIIAAQGVNTALAVLFFYAIPAFGIAPKTILFLFLILSSFLIILWRLSVIPRIDVKKHHALLIGNGPELKELKEEVNNNTLYNLAFISSVELDEIEELDIDAEIINQVYSENISSIVIDLHHPKVTPLLPKLYNLIFSKVQFVDFYKLYEDIFDRIPLPLLNYTWFIENVSSSRTMYDIFKRLIDIAFSLIGLVVMLILLPFVALFIKYEDRGPIFIKQERIGKGNRVIRVYKFRSMKSFEGDRGVWVSEGDNRITRTGSFLRKSRIDELPQLLSVLKGDMSLIGPRPDIIGLWEKLSKEVPYYNVRNLIKPGLSGWAQIKQDLPPQSLEETKMRLSYDLYYLKNRSFFLDFKIMLQTIKTLLLRTGK